MRRKTYSMKKTGYYIDLDRRRRVLYTADSLLILQIKTGLEIKDLLKTHISWIPILVWAGLIWEDPGLKIKEVEEMIEEKTGGNEMAIGRLTLSAIKAMANYEGDQKFRESIFRRMGE